MTDPADSAPVADECVTDGRVTEGLPPSARRVATRRFPRTPLRKVRISAAPVRCGIPKILHQTFYSRDLPQDVADNIGRLRAANPDWEYRFYDESAIRAFIGEAYGEDVLAHFDALDPDYGAAKADLFRYLVVYSCGGVYLDIKSTLNAPLDNLLSATDSYLVSHWRNRAGEEFEGWGVHRELKRFGGEELQQWYIAASPGHPLLRAVIGRVCRNIRRYNPAIAGVGRRGVLNVTGPIAYSAAILPLLPRYPHRVVSREATGFEYSIWSAQAHRTRLAGHYSTLNSPLVQSGPFTGLIASAVTAARALRSKFTNSPEPRPHGPPIGRPRPAAHAADAGETS